MSKVLALSSWLYGLFLHAYPAAFRRVYGARMARVFRDSCRDALQQHGVAMGFAFLTMVACAVSLGYAFRLPSRQSR